MRSRLLSSSYKLLSICKKCVHLFSASAHRWNVMCEQLNSTENAGSVTVSMVSDGDKNEKSSHFLVAKSLYETRWCCSADATKALAHCYGAFKLALIAVVDDPQQKADVRNEAHSLAKKIGRAHV